MNIQNHRLVKIIFAVFLSLTVSQASALKDIKDVKYSENEKKEHENDKDKDNHKKNSKHHDDCVISVDAGDDQVVNAGEMVYLRGTIKYGENNKKNSKHHDHLVIKWRQDIGTKVHLIKRRGLRTKFVAPTPFASDEILVFTLTVNRHGEVISSDSVEVKAQGQVNAPTISGRITAVDGTELPDISINVLSSDIVFASDTSDANGDFFFDLDGNSDFVLALSGDGYADQVVPVRTPITPGSLFLDITMIMRGSTSPQSFPVGSSQGISGPDGSSVFGLGGVSFVDVNGDPVTGDIDVTITPVDVSRQAYLAAFPGEFSGVLEGAREASPFYSLGAAEFEFSQNGQPVQLASEQSVFIRIPIYFANYQNGDPIYEGHVIPLWSLNEDTGIWEQEGTGTVTSTSGPSPTGLVLEATVDHFSWWNCDVTMNAAQVIVIVSGEPGTALIKARTNADIGWRPNTVETVSQVNILTSPLYIPSDSEVCFWAEINFDNGSSSSTPEVCITVASGDPQPVTVTLGSPPVAVPVDIITIPATATDRVVGYVGFAVNRVQLLPRTYETEVTYTIISGLPAGLSLNRVNATRAEITGVPEQDGMFEVVVEATDDDGNTDTITIYYEIIADVVPS